MLYSPEPKLRLGITPAGRAGVLFYRVVKKEKNQYTISMTTIQRTQRIHYRAGTILFLLIALTAVGCRRAPKTIIPNPEAGAIAQPIPAATNCPADVLTCPDGTVIQRQPPYCLFAPCPQGATVNCPTDTLTCADGTVLRRQGTACEFSDCPDIHRDESYRPSTR
jgi:hypothetical protein